MASIKCMVFSNPVRVTTPLPHRSNPSLLTRILRKVSVSPTQRRAEQNSRELIDALKDYLNLYKTHRIQELDLREVLDSLTDYHDPLGLVHIANNLRSIRVTHQTTLYEQLETQRERVSTIRQAIRERREIQNPFPGREVFPGEMHEPWERLTRILTDFPSKGFDNKTLEQGFVELDSFFWSYARRSSDFVQQRTDRFIIDIGFEHVRRLIYKIHWSDSVYRNFELTLLDLLWESPGLQIDSQGFRHWKQLPRTDPESLDQHLEKIETQLRSEGKLLNPFSVDLFPQAGYIEKSTLTKLDRIIAEHQVGLDIPTLIRIVEKARARLADPDWFIKEARLMMMQREVDHLIDPRGRIESEMIE